MDRLSYKSLEESGYNGFIRRELPERVLQFGEGNFLRAFADYFIDIANEKCGFDAGVTVIQPIPSGLTDVINEQEGLYTLYMRGFEAGEKLERKRVISCLKRCVNPYEDYNAFLASARNPDLRYIISNTTEAGIVFDTACGFEDAPPSSFPAKLTRFLYERYKTFGTGHGLVVLSCELIDNNGNELRKCVNDTITLWELVNLWNIERGFAHWVKQEVLFCNTLVDRITSGYPKSEAAELNAANGYEDKLLVTSETFGLWVIEGPDWLRDELPFEKAGLPVHVVRDHTPYKQRKVRILNGAHTSTALAHYLAGYDTVSESMSVPWIRSNIERTIHQEIIPTLTLPKDDMDSFAKSVIERFMNPFISHNLLSITLNSTSKWRARVLPSLKEYVRLFSKLPERLTFSFAAYLAFYHGSKLTDDGLEATRGDETYLIQDDRYVLEFFFSLKDANAEALTKAVCANIRMWGEDLNAIPGFTDAAAGYLNKIWHSGVESCLKPLR